VEHDDIVRRLKIPCIEKGLDEQWIDAERKEAADIITVCDLQIVQLRDIAEVSREEIANLRARIKVLEGGK
jgi:hypothetical protein